MKRIVAIFPVIVMIALTFGVGGCGEEKLAKQEPSTRTTLVEGSKSEPAVPLPKGRPPTDLVVKDLKIGRGVVAHKGDVLVTKLVADFVGGHQLESSWNPGAEPFVFQLGNEEANPGWEKGLPGMRVGGRRLLVVPPDEGSRFGPVREGKPKDTLVYVVELVAVIPPELRDRTRPHVRPPAQAPPRQLRSRTLIKGTGPVAHEGDILTVEYVGIRYDGSPFSNSWKRRKPFSFKLGSGSIKVSAGWEQGLQGMRVGERRELVIPPKLLLPGSAGTGGKPSDSLVYVVDLMGITEDRN